MTGRTSAGRLALGALTGPLTTASRFAAAILGGYGFAYGFTALATLGGHRAGLTFSDGQTLAWMVGMLVYLGAILWGFAARSLVWAWVWLAGGGALMGATAFALSRWPS